MGKGVRLKSYIDALNAERNRTSNWRAAAIVGTGGAMIFGIMQATKVLALTFEKRMDTTNEWRGALEDQAKDKAPVQQLNALKEQVDKLEDMVTARTNRQLGAGQLAGIIAGAITAGGVIATLIYTFAGAAS